MNSSSPKQILKQAITACALLHKVENGTTKIFLAKRADNKKFLPGVYEIPGGHIDYGENLVDGLKREIDEEFGAKITIGEPFAAFTYTNEVKNTHSVEIVYFSEFVDEKQITLDEKDHSESIWISEDEISKVFTPKKGADDEEFVVLKRAFELLNGGEMRKS